MSANSNQETQVTWKQNLFSNKYDGIEVNCSCLSTSVVTLMGNRLSTEMTDLNKYSY